MWQSQEKYVHVEVGILICFKPCECGVLAFHLLFFLFLTVGRDSWFEAEERGLGRTEYVSCTMYLCVAPFKMNHVFNTVADSV